MTKVQNQSFALPANMSVKAALAAGIVPANAQVSTVNGVAVGKGFANATVQNLIGAGVLDPSLPGSAIVFAGGYGGD